VTRPDPDASDPVTECLCFELRDYLEDGVLIVMFSAKTLLVYAAHIQLTKISNIILKLLSIEK